MVEPQALATPCVYLETAGQTLVLLQVGATPPGVEIPVGVADSSAVKEFWAPGNEPVIPHGPDPKWRFMWRVGRRPASTRFPEMNADPVIPKGKGPGMALIAYGMFCTWHVQCSPLIL